MVKFISWDDYQFNLASECAYLSVYLLQ